MSDVVDKMCTRDPLVWAEARHLQVRPGVPFALAGMPYLSEIVKSGKRITNVKKGTQLCLTTTNFVSCLHALYYNKYDQNILYMMPSVKAVESMASVSFDPLLNGNPDVFKKSVVTVNKISTKTINGRSMVFVGAQPTKMEGGAIDSSALRSTPCDRIDRDEVDMMDPAIAEMSKQRLQRSRFRIENNWGSPTTPSWGIDALYEGSDKRKWQIKCQHCEKHTCLGDSFPDCVQKIDGIWSRACVYCGKEIYVHDGRWEAENPDAREAGFWVSGLLSPFCDLEDAMYRYEHNDKNAEFMRSILGIATTDAECQLTHQAVRECCGQDNMRLSSSVETCMGVDIGKHLHAVVGIRTGSKTYHILAVKECESYDQLHDFAKKMNVRQTVMDAGPYDHGARDYQKSHSGTTLCYYSENQPGNPVWNSKEKTVKVNRNEWCDMVYETYMDQKIIIPRPSPLVNEYIRQLTCTEKTEVTNDAGMSRPRWCKRGDDHYFHSTLYFLLAASRAAPTTVEGKQKSRPSMQVNNFV